MRAVFRPENHTFSITQTDQLLIIWCHDQNSRNPGYLDWHLNDIQKETYRSRGITGVAETLFGEI